MNSQGRTRMKCLLSIQFGKTKYNHQLVASEFLIPYLIIIGQIAHSNHLQGKDKMDIEHQYS